MAERKMTLAEAEAVLTERNYCLEHLCPMIEEKPQNPMSNACAAPFYYCAKCRHVEQQQDAARLEEALRIVRDATKVAEAPRG